MPAQPSTAPAASGELALVALLASLAMIGPFTIDTIYPGYQRIGREFAVGNVELQQITGVYMLTFALMSVFHGPLSDAAGRKPVILLGLLGYLLASVACALAPSLTSLLIFRAMQGLCAGAATIISRVIIRDLYSGARAQQLMSQLMLIFALGPAIAPIVGGWILWFGDWPLIFGFCAAYALLLMIATHRMLPESLPPEKRQTLAVLPLLASLRKVGGNPRFERVAFASALLFATYFIYVVSAPIVIVDLLGLGERDFWVLFVPMIGGMAIGSIVSHRLAERVDPGRLADHASLAMIVAAVINVLLMAWRPEVPWVIVGPMLLGIANGINLPIMQLTLIELFPENRGAAASMGTFATLLFNAMLASLLAPFVTQSLLIMAASSLAFAIAGNLLWRGHRRSEATTSGQLGR